MQNQRKLAWCGLISVACIVCAALAGFAALILKDPDYLLGAGIWCAILAYIIRYAETLLD